VRMQSLATAEVVREHICLLKFRTIESGEETVKEPPAVTAVDDAGLDGRMRNKAR
jgi:hypothetical protein